jgi:hypothetical protein
MKNRNIVHILWIRVYLRIFRVSLHVTVTRIDSSYKFLIFPCHSNCGLTLSALHEVIILSGSVIKRGNYNDAVNLLLVWEYEGNKISNPISNSRFPLMFRELSKTGFRTYLRSSLVRITGFLDFVHRAEF